jgi:hypothetical protein
MKPVKRFEISEEEIQSTIETSARAFREWLATEIANGGAASHAEGLGVCQLAVKSLEEAIRLTDIKPHVDRDRVRVAALDLASASLWIVATLAREHRP